ncbi:MAG: FtsH protease activity modulator HflK [Anaerolineae bacterium]|nr:FtsH protease activity modulator HflK [Anaerolineae bacterium]
MSEQEPMTPSTEPRAEPESGDGEKSPQGPLPAIRVLGNIARGALASIATIGGDAAGDMRSAIGNLPKRGIVFGVIALLILVYLLSGVYVVAPGEAAVVRRFGAVMSPPQGEGLHYRLPWPVDQVDIVNVGEVRRESVCLTEAEPEHPDHPEKPEKLQAITGDTNVIDVELIVQYQVSDPVAYLFNSRYAPYRLVRDAVRYAVTQLTVTRGVDAILTSERQAYQDGIRAEAQKQLDAYNSGLQIVGLSLQKAYPPDEVANAFRDVSSAREDKTRAVNEAQGYANSIIPEARGQAQNVLSQAQAYQSDAIGRAQGGAQAFNAVLQEYQKSTQIYGSELTRYRLYLETLDLILPRVQTYVVDVKNGSTFNLRLFGNSSGSNGASENGNDAPPPQSLPQP